MAIVPDQNFKRSSELVLVDDQQNGVQCRNLRQKMPNSTVPSKRLGLIRRLMPRNLHPRIECILYWRDVRKTMMVLIAGLMLFSAISYYGFLSVVSHLSLALLTSTFILRICSRIFGRSLIANFPQCDNLDDIVLKSLDNVLFIVAEIRDIVFVKNIFRTLKFCFIIHIWTIIGDFMNGFTLMVCVFIALFIIPKFCELMWPKFLLLTERVIRYCKSKLQFADYDD